MPVTLKKTVAVLDGNCSVEEAEALMGWLLENKKGKVNLRQCEHLHAAILQVLIVLAPTISVMPDHQPLAAWIRAAMPWLASTVPSHKETAKSGVSA